MNLDAAATNSQKESKLAEFLRSGGKRSSEINKNPSINKHTLKRELLNYLKESPITIDYCPLNWWKEHHQEYPHVAKVARAYLAIPGSQSTSERMFSLAGNIVTEKRGCTLTNHVEQIAYLNDNVNLQNVKDENF